MRYGGVVHAGTLVREARMRSGLSKTAFARAVRTSRMALDLIEAGRRDPGLDLLNRIARAGGLALRTTSAAVEPVDVETLADAVAALDSADDLWAWRWLTGDYVPNVFVPATPAARAASLQPTPPVTSTRWDVVVDALAEHLAHHAGLPRPAWVTEQAVQGGFWWPVHGDLPSTRAAALAHSPASFLRRGILIDGRDLPDVTP
jgi:transcriptional regulator with XRE-family HTH domain